MGLFERYLSVWVLLSILAGILLGTENLPQKLCKFVLAKMDKETNYTVIVGHSNKLNDGKKLFDLLQRENNKIKKKYKVWPYVWSRSIWFIK